MKKLLIVICLVLLSMRSYSQIWVQRTNESYKKDANGNMYVYQTTYDSILEQPNWQGLQNDLYDTSHVGLFVYAMTKALPNPWSSLLKCISDGESRRSTPDNFLFLLNACQIPFDSLQINEFNAV